MTNVLNKLKQSIVDYRDDHEHDMFDLPLIIVLGSIIGIFVGYTVIIFN